RQGKIILVSFQPHLPAGSANLVTKSTNRILSFISQRFLFYLSLSAAPLVRSAQQQTDRNALRASSNLLAAAARPLSNPPPSPTAILPRFFRVQLPLPVPPPLLEPTAVNLRRGLAAPPAR
uniref:Uncharacterized protein n=1 Tax=Aegilops tauschii subsp. strangulata TaxID=200361 RepID=A0A453FSR0_AEGTS